MLILNLFLDSISHKNNIITTVLIGAKQAKVDSSFFGMSTGIARIVIPTIVTLFVFTLGQIISWISNKRERRNNLSMLKSVIEIWVESVKGSVDLNIKGINDFGDELANSKELHPATLQFTPMLVDKLKELKLTEFQDVIHNIDLKEDKGKMIYNIVSQIEFLSEIMKYIEDEYIQFKSSTLKFMDEYNDNFILFNKLLNDAGIDIFNLPIKEASENNFIIEKNKICNKYLADASGSSVDFDDVYTLLIDPINSIVNTFIKDSENKNLVEKLAYTLQDLQILKRKWDIHKSGHRDLAKVRAVSINKSYKSLSSNVKKMKDSKIVGFLNIK